MAIWRGGVDVGGSIGVVGVTPLSSARAQGLLRESGIVKDGKTFHPVMRDANGNVALYRRALIKANGLQNPVQFKMTFNCPAGINQPNLETYTQTHEYTLDAREAYSRSTKTRQTRQKWSQSEPDSKVKGGGLDWQTHKMNASTAGIGEGSIKQKYDNAAQICYTMWDPDGLGLTDKQKTRTHSEGKYPTQENILDLFCSKVSIPEKSINFTSMRHYGTHFPYPQSVSYGTLSTTFYCDGSMHIKNFFDAWQKLIYNDITGNFNYYEEYISEFDIYTRTTLPVRSRSGLGVVTTKSTPKDEKNWIQKSSAKLDDWTGVGKPEDAPEHPKVKLEFRNNYGVKVMQAWPQIVSAIDLGHQSTNSVGEFTVTWVYKKWNTFNLGDVAKRRKINLPTGVAADDATGFPFIRDLPPELSGPLTEGINQGVVTSPLNNFSSLV